MKIGSICPTTKATDCSQNNAYGVVVYAYLG